MTERDVGQYGTPLPLAGRGRGGGRSAAATVQVKPVGWERDASALSTHRTQARAEILRRQLTPPEKRLWWHLRHTLSIESTHFRRQVAVGRYVVDFCCLKTRLIIEVDGNQHGSDANAIYDQIRTQDLEALGFRVLRFSNQDVMMATTEVLDTIYAAGSILPPTPGPSPQGGGESAGSCERELPA